jgi:hypothetical protein
MDFPSRYANVLEISPNLRLVVMAPIAVTNVTLEMVFVMSPVIPLRSAVITVPFAVMVTPFSVIIVAPVVMMAIAVFGFGRRRQPWNS